MGGGGLRLPVARLPRTVRGLSWVSGLNDAASEMVYPLLPAYLVGTLGAPALALGILDGAADLTAALLRVASGRLADRPGRRSPLVLIGYLLAAVARPLIAVARSVPLVIGLRITDRFGKGLRSPARDAMLAAAVPDTERGRAFGYHRAFDHGGAVIGSLLAAAGLALGLGVPQVIAASAIPGALVLGALWWTLRDQRAAGVPLAPPSAPTGTTIRVYWSSVATLALLIAVRLPETLVLLHLQRGGVGVAIIPLVWAALHVVKSGVAYPAGRLVDRIGERRVVALSGIAGALGAALLAAAAAPSMLVAAFLVLGLVTGIGEPAERTLVARLAPRGIGRAYGEAQALFGTLALAAGVGYGMLVDRAGSAAALFTWAVLAVAVTVLWLMVTARTAIARGVQG